MAIVQDEFYIPADIATGLTTGLYRRNGSVVRYASGPNKGRIVKLLDSANYNVAEQAQGVGVKALQFVKDHKKGTILTAVGATAIVSGLVICDQVKNREPKVLTEFRVSLRTYIDAIRRGNMDIYIITDLMEHIKKIKEHKKYDMISAQLSNDELEIVVKRIYIYILEFAKDNNIELLELEEDHLEKKNGDAIINLENYLKAQKCIFEKEA